MAAENKPPFGPLETPAIFAGKWYRQFHKHGMAPNWTTNEEWVDWLSRGFELYMGFEKQRRALGSGKDALVRIRILYGPQPTRLDDVWSGAERTRDLINYQLETGAQAMRRQGKAMPEAKAKFDVLMDKVILAAAEGIWKGDVSDRAWEVLEKTMKKSSK
ncbi:hypothetical protein BST61_g1594 [Cercospora zeina]